MQPDLDTLKSLRSLFDQVDFKRFRKFLEAIEEAETYRAIHAVENPDVARGRAQMITWLRNQIETCQQAASVQENRLYGQPTAPGSTRSRAAR